MIFASRIQAVRLRNLFRTIPRKWLNSSRVAEISHCGTCNFSFSLEFKYIGDSD